ncbi:hypothetical protein WDW89_01515 [Deltaproteobacteria bacterium TL4]
MSTAAHWKDQTLHIYKELAPYTSPFVQDFRIQLYQALRRVFLTEGGQGVSSPASPFQKGFIHALRLYDLQAVLLLIENYDPCQGQERFLSNLKKCFHSLSVIPTLEKLTTSVQESHQLTQYQVKLEKSLTSYFQCGTDKLYQKSLMNQQLRYFKNNDPDPYLLELFCIQRLNLLFSPAYIVYLILRNRYFITKLLQGSQDPAMELWLKQKLTEQLPSGWAQPLDVSLKALDFRSIEQWMKQLNALFPLHPLLQQETASLLVDLEEDPDTDLQLPEECEPSSPLLESTGLVLQKATLIQPPQALPSLPLETGPEHPLQRSPFERLCFQYAKELLYYSRSIVFVSECSSPYFRAKSEEYLSSVPQEFETFFGNRLPLYEAYNEFVRVLLIQTQRDNPFDIRREQIPLYLKTEGQWQKSGLTQRNREWSLMLGAKLPFSITLSHPAQQRLRIEKGWKFVLQLGNACFDYDLPKYQRIHTQAAGYLKLLFQGRRLSPHSSVVYIGRTPYYTLTQSQMLQGQGMILLFLIAIRNRFEVDFSEPFKSYLVEVLPQTLDEIRTLN